MPLFGSSKHHDPTPTTHAPPRHSTSSETSPRHSSGGGFFSSSRRRSSSPDTRSSKLSHNTSTNRSSGGGLFHRNHNNHEDPSIVAARERVLSAEAAERDADRALVQARAAVREAREHIKIIEHEAAEEARLAKIKQKNARDISKRAKPLGRKYYPNPFCLRKYLVGVLLTLVLLGHDHY